MTAARAPRIVVLGMLTRLPVAGVVWQTVHYLLGFERLGYEVWYVEAHGLSPYQFQEHADDHSSARAVAWLDATLRPFGFGDRWVFQEVHADDECFGLSRRALHELYDSAALIVNLHGGTVPRSEFADTGRLVYLETDPVAKQVELAAGEQATIDLLEPHVAFFTFGEGYGTPGCALPVSDRFRFLPTRQPVVLDLWEGQGTQGEVFTTIGSYRQPRRQVELDGEVYEWSKDLEWAKVLALPARTGQRFELALSRHRRSDELRLTRQGWTVRPAAEISQDADVYRAYVASSLGEFTVAKDQNVRLRSGWFSDRSATYLAAGRPVITQETGFSDHLPTGEGLLPFTTLDEAVGAVEAVAADPGRHGRAALETAREHFAAETVLRRLLDEVGV